MSAWIPTVLVCPGCGCRRDNPKATARDENGEWQRLVNVAAEQPCTSECAALAEMLRATMPARGCR